MAAKKTTARVPMNPGGGESLSWKFNCLGGWHRSGTMNKKAVPSSAEKMKRMPVFIIIQKRRRNALIGRGILCQSPRSVGRTLAGDKEHGACCENDVS
jgi:hypothetical protein